MAQPQPIHNEPLTGFDGHYGLELLRADGDGINGRVAVTPQVLQAHGLVHGGVYAAMAESMASIGTAIGAGQGKFVAGMSNSTSFLRPVTQGTVHAEASPRHRGRTTWVWDVDFCDDDGRLCASARVTIAVREARA